MSVDDLAQPLRKTQIVVVGGGAGGLELVRRLGARYGRAMHDIILVERNRTHVWKPLLHEVAAGSLDANLDEVGYRSHCFQWRYRFFLGTLSEIDRDCREVVIAPLLDDDGREVMGPHRVRYDYLVLAVGSVINDFGTPGVAQHCLYLDDQGGADRFRNKLLNQCLRVSRELAACPTTDARVRITIVGGGATGVELAAELFNSAAALHHYGLEVFDESRLMVTLVEAGPRILPGLPDQLADAAKAELEALGVRVMTSVKVTEATDGAIVTESGEHIASDLMVWAAGVKGAFPGDRGGLEVNHINQLLVRPTLQTTLDDRIFAIGDCCSCTLGGSERPVPPRAQAAHQMANTVLANIGRLTSGRPLMNFVYRDYGSLVSLSRFSTVGTLMGNLIGGRMAIEGRLARLAYKSLYWMHLVAVQGWIRGVTLLVIGRLNSIIRPRLKLH